MKSVKTLLLSVNIFIVFAVAAVIGLTARKSMLNQITTSLDVYKQTLYEGYDNAVEYQVQSVIALLQSIYNRQQAGELSQEAAQKEAIDYIKSLRYGEDGSGYFWVDDTDYILVAHPILEEQEGDNRYDLEDQNGVKIIQEILKTVQASEEGGFNEFYYTKSDGVTVAPKRAFSMLFKPWGWIVSTGNYTDEIEGIYSKQEKQMDAQLRWQLQMSNLCVVIMVIVAVIISIVYARKFTQPLRKIRDLAVRMSKCDFSQPVEIKSKNEFGQTAKTLNEAQDTLRVYIHDISRLIHEMSDGNFEIHAEADYEGE
ncbi:MAG: cache domain-containing protein, partial [Lachnospiraceae bacterium]|nr:cache domain-containing protein [Lachnospiraceae bacterium]